MRSPTPDRFFDGGGHERAAGYARAVRRGTAIMVSGTTANDGHGGALTRGGHRRADDGGPWSGAGGNRSTRRPERRRRAHTHLPGSRRRLAGRVDGPRRSVRRRQPGEHDVVRACPHRRGLPRRGGDRRDRRPTESSPRDQPAAEQRRPGRRVHRARPARRVARVRSDLGLQRSVLPVGAGAPRRRGDGDAAGSPWGRASSIRTRCTRRRSP